MAMQPVAVAVVVDLRPASLFAVSKARYHGRPLLMAAVDRLVATQLAATVVVATPQDRQAVAGALAALAPHPRVFTGEELAASFADLGDGHIVWLRSLVLDLDAADVVRLSLERTSQSARAFRPRPRARFTPARARSGRRPRRSRGGSRWPRSCRDCSSPARRVTIGTPRHYRCLSSTRSWWISRTLLRCSGISANAAPKPCSWGASTWWIGRA